MVFLTTHSMNKFTIISIPTYLWFAQMPNIETKGWYILHHNISVLKCSHIYIGFKNHFVGNSSCNIINLKCPNVFLLKNNVRFTFSVGDTTRAVCT